MTYWILDIIYQLLYNFQKQLRVRKIISEFYYHYPFILNARVMKGNGNFYNVIKINANTLNL